MLRILILLNSVKGHCFDFFKLNLFFWGGGCGCFFVVVYYILSPHAYPRFLVEPNAWFLLVAGYQVEDSLTYSTVSFHRPFLLVGKGGSKSFSYYFLVLPKMLWSLCQSLFFVPESQSLRPATLLKKRLWHPRNLPEEFRFLQN